MYIVLHNMYVTMSISIGFYPNLDLWNANKLHYVKVFKSASGGHSLTLFHINCNRSGHTFKNLYGHDQALPTAKYNTGNPILLHILLNIPTI